MTVIHVTTRAGEERELHGEAGHSVMEVIRAGGLHELQALCGGACACATCHVYIDPVFLLLLPSLSRDEDDLLDSSSYRTELSRLSCQLRCVPALDGLKLRIAPED